ncbi:hypothetical protein OJAV_G00218810 [Oryzias javanicus]|uniref:A kinase-anchoring proteins AKAP-5 and AKAP-12 calmodulin (CaM)-binding domain-containing protein n=1 Tax=Oryzias javanicus TaxID=123683 RepID=A0A3S2LNJ3_ORYJA|nr:hypothetical protein OJAV_G00218810 [Oryzias javanicus]
MGDAQSAQREDRGSEQEAPTDTKETIYPLKPLRNNGQISELAADEEVNGLCEEVLPREEEEEEDTPTGNDEEDEAGEAQEDDKQNDLNDGFKKFFSNISLKLTVKRGSADRGETERPPAEEEEEEEEEKPEGGEATAGQEAQNDSSSYQTLLDETSPGKVPAPPEEEPPPPPSSPDDRDTPFKKFFSTGLFSGLKKKKKSTDEEVPEKELTDLRRRKEQEVIPGVEVTAAEGEPEENRAADEAQSSPLKRLLSGSSFKRSSKKQRGRRSSEGRLSISGEHGSDLHSSTESAEAPAQTPSDPAAAEEGAWSSFKKLVTPQKLRKKSEDVSASAEAEQTLDQSPEEAPRRKDSSVSWEAVLCGSGRRRSRRTSDSEEDLPQEKPEKEEAPGGGAEASAEEEEASTWRSFKKLVTPKRKAKDEDEGKDTAQPEDAPQEESSFSIKRLLSGQKKRRSVEKQAAPGEAEQEEPAGEDETPAVVPLSEFDQSETTGADGEPQQHLHEETQQLLTSGGLQAEEKNSEGPGAPQTDEEPEDLTDDSRDLQPLSDIPEEGAITEGAELDDTLAEKLLELTSEAITAPEPTEETEMVSAVSQLSESSRTSGNSTPEPEDTEMLQEEVSGTSRSPEPIRAPPEEQSSELSPPLGDLEAQSRGTQILGSGGTSEEKPREEPLKEEPPSEEPLKEEPLKEEPPSEEPLKEELPSEEPPSEEPPSEEPKSEEPPSEEPLKEEPPSEEPPSEEPPSEEPCSPEPDADQEMDIQLEASADELHLEECASSGGSETFLEEQEPPEDAEMNQREEEAADEEAPQELLHSKEETPEEEGASSGREDGPEAASQDVPSGMIPPGEEPEEPPPLQMDQPDVTTQADLEGGAYGDARPPPEDDRPSRGRDSSAPGTHDEEENREPADVHRDISTPSEVQEVSSVETPEVGPPEPDSEEPQVSGDPETSEADQGANEKKAPPSDDLQPAEKDPDEPTQTSEPLKEEIEEPDVPRKDSSGSAGESEEDLVEGDLCSSETAEEPRLEPEVPTSVHTEPELPPEAFAPDPGEEERESAGKEPEDKQPQIQEDLTNQGAEGGPPDRDRSDEVPHPDGPAERALRTVPQEVQAELQDGSAEEAEELPASSALHVSSISEEPSSAWLLEKTTCTQTTAGAHAQVCAEPLCETKVCTVEEKLEGGAAAPLPAGEARAAVTVDAAALELLASSLRETLLKKPHLLLHEPLIGVVAGEEEFNGALETTAPLEGDDVSQSAEEASVVLMMHIPTVEYEENHRIQVQVKDVDIHSAEAGADSLVELGVTESRQVIDVCHECIRSVESLSAASHVVEELIHEVAEVTFHDVVQEIQGNFTQDKWGNLLALEDVVYDLQAAGLEARDSKGLEILRAERSEHLLHVYDHTDVEQLRPGGAGAGQNLSEVQNQQNQVAGPNSGTVSSIGNVEPPSSLSLEFKLNIQFGQARPPAPPAGRPDAAQQADTPESAAQNQNQNAAQEPDAPLRAAQQHVGVQAMELSQPLERVQTAERRAAAAAAVEAVQPPGPREKRSVFLGKPEPSEPRTEAEEETDQDVWLDAEEDLQAQEGAQRSDRDRPAGEPGTATREKTSRSHWKIWNPERLLQARTDRLDIQKEEAPPPLCSSC